MKRESAEMPTLPPRTLGRLRKLSESARAQSACRKALDTIDTIFKAKRDFDAAWPELADDLAAEYSRIEHQIEALKAFEALKAKEGSKAQGHRKSQAGKARKAIDDQAVDEGDD